MHNTATLNTPWALVIEHDGTENVAIIRDANGDDLATSRPFWMPEGDEPVPVTLAAMRLMAAGPKLLEALSTAEKFVRGFEGDEVQEGIDKMLSTIRDAMAEATTEVAT